jgi:hypothetical protein
MNKLIYGIDECDNIVLGSNKYDYSSDETIMNLIKEKKKVRLTNDIDRPLDFLPYGVEELRLGGIFNYLIDNLPSSLKYLEISKYSGIGYCCFNKTLDYLPIGLEELRLYYCNNGYYNQRLDNLPSSLKILHIHNLKCINTSTENTIIPKLSNLPESIEFLYLNNYDFDFNLQVLPSRLKTFNLGFKYTNANDLHSKQTLLNTFMNKQYPHVTFTIGS